MTTHPGALHTHLTTTRRPRSVPQARTRLTRTLRRWNVPPATVDDTALLLSELLTNAVHHGTGPTLTIHTTYHHGVVHCHVHDDGPHTPLPPPPPPGQPLDALTESGRGLHLVHALATRWGTHLDTRHPHARHVVWFQLDTTHTPPPPPHEPPPDLPRRRPPTPAAPHTPTTPHNPTVPDARTPPDTPAPPGTPPAAIHAETDPAVLRRVLAALRAL